MAPICLIWDSDCLPCAMSISPSCDPWLWSNLKQQPPWSFEPFSRSLGSLIWHSELLHTYQHNRGQDLASGPWFFIKRSRLPLGGHHGYQSVPVPPLYSPAGELAYYVELYFWVLNASWNTGRLRHSLLYSVRRPKCPSGVLYKVTCCCFCYIRLGGAAHTHLLWFLITPSCKI